MDMECYKSILSEFKYIHCKDCKFYNENDLRMPCRLHGMDTLPDEYCSLAVASESEEETEEEEET